MGAEGGKELDYSQYVYTKREKIRYGSCGGAAAFVILMLFYDHLVVCGIGAIAAAMLFLKYYRRILMKKRRWELTVQFKDATESLVSALVAGYSLENAVRQTERDLRMMYDEGDIIMLEFSQMTHKMDLSVPAAELLKDLGMRSGVEDIRTFSEILMTARKTGGNLVKVMKRTAGNIAERIEMKREIETLISGKRMEANCMTAIPLLIIVYLRIFSPGFLDPLYHNIMGVCVMTGALVVFAAAFLWGQKLMDVQL